MNRKNPQFFAVGLILLLDISCTRIRQSTLFDEAQRLCEADKYQGAVDSLQRLIQYQPNSSLAKKAYYLLATIYEQHLAEIDLALLNYEEFLNLTESGLEQKQVKRHVADLYFERHLSPEKALSIYYELIDEIKDSSESANLRFRIARALADQGKFAESKDQYQQIIDTPNMEQDSVSRSRLEIANIYYTQANYDSAYEAYKQVIRYHGISQYAIEAEFLMGNCLEFQQKWKQALEIYKSLEGRYLSPNVLQIRIKKTEQAMAFAPQVLGKKDYRAR